MSWQRLQELVGQGSDDCEECQQHWQSIRETVEGIVADAVGRRRRWWQRKGDDGGE